MEKLLAQERFGFVSQKDKSFILAFDQAMGPLGYDFGGAIGSGYCWGRAMIIYSKTGVKAKKVAARIYMRDDGIVLRLFFTGIDKRRAYIENAPDHIRQVFLPGPGDCHNCPGKPQSGCGFQKSYTIGGTLIRKCSGSVFEFPDPDMEKLPDYLGLFEAFYPVRAKKA